MSQICQQETGIKIDPYEAIPQMLIGQDYGNLIVSREVIEIRKSNLLLSRCNLGWMIHGKTFDKIRKQHSGTVINCINEVNKQENESLDNLMKEYFELDSLGVSTYSRVKTEDLRALNILDETSRHTGIEWEVGLLWKDEKLIITESRLNAIKRLDSLERKFMKDEGYYQMYKKEMSRLIENGFAKRVYELPRNRVWYVSPSFRSNKHK